VRRGAGAELEILGPLNDPQLSGGEAEDAGMVGADPEVAAAVFEQGGDIVIGEAVADRVEAGGATLAAVESFAGGHPKNTMSVLQQLVDEGRGKFGVEGGGLEGARSELIDAVMRGSPKGGAAFRESIHAADLVRIPLAVFELGDTGIRGHPERAVARRQDPTDLLDPAIRVRSIEEVEEALAVKAAESFRSACPEVAVVILADSQNRIAGQALVRGPNAMDIAGGEGVLGQ